MTPADLQDQRGFSLAEMLVVIAMVGILVAIGIPLVNEQVRIAEARSAADQIAVHLRAARMIAISQRQDVVVNLLNEAATPVPPNCTTANCLYYIVTTGKTQSMTMPGTVKIKSGSAASVTFHSDGSAAAAATVTAESVVSSAIERWTLSVNTLGLVTVAHARV